MQLSNWTTMTVLFGAATGLAAAARRKLSLPLTISRHFQRVGEIDVSDLLVAVGLGRSRKRGKLEIALYLTVRRSPAEPDDGAVLR